MAPTYSATTTSNHSASEVWAAPTWKIHRPPSSLNPLSARKSLQGAFWGVGNTGLTFGQDFNRWVLTGSAISKAYSLGNEVYKQ